MRMPSILRACSRHWHAPLRAAAFALCLAAFSWNPAFADYLEVQRAAIAHASPDASSGTLKQLAVGDQLALLESNQTSGYYHVSVDGTPAWVYRTFVRRFAGDLPGSTGAGGAVPGSTPPPVGPALDATPFRPADCPPEGTAKSAKLQALNQLKNRGVGPAPNQITPLTVEDLLFQEPDQTKWNPSTAVELTGYVAEVKPGGDETCNCGASDPSLLDTHIVLVSDPGEVNTTHRVIVEVTPAWRALMKSRGTDWATATLEHTLPGHYVKVQGWLLFDSQHANAADNTNPSGAHNWRGTAWEVHPITAMQVLSTPVP